MDYVHSFDAIRDIRFFLKPELEMFNIGGTYQVVDPDMEPFIRQHEEMHRRFQDGYRKANSPRSEHE